MTGVERGSFVHRCLKEIRREPCQCDLGLEIPEESRQEGPKAAIRRARDERQLRSTQEPRTPGDSLARNPFSGQGKTITPAYVEFLARSVFALLFSVFRSDPTTQRFALIDRVRTSLLLRSADAETGASLVS